MVMQSRQGARRHLLNLRLAEYKMSGSRPPAPLAGEAPSGVLGGAQKLAAVYDQIEGLAPRGA